MATPCALPTVPASIPIVGEATAGRMPPFHGYAGQCCLYHDRRAAAAGRRRRRHGGRDGAAGAAQRDCARAHRQRVKPGADVRPVGYDVATGEEVLPAGVRLGAAELGLLATVGQAMVPVVRQPRVAVLSTGDELADAGARLAPGKIRDSNRITLLAAVTAAGGEAIDLGIAPDDQAQLEAKVRQGLRQADIVVTSGGVSMGNLDFIKPLLERCRDRAFWPAAHEAGQAAHLCNRRRVDGAPAGLCLGCRATR